MTTRCPYCSDSIPEKAYEDHLQREHGNELTAIDRRRVSSPDSDSSRRNAALYAGVAVAIVLLVVAYTMVLAPSASTSEAAVQPDETSEIHEHGTITVQYDGEVVEFDDPQYVEQDECFHFHGYDNAAVWHTHCEDVTIEYALETLGMEVSADRLVVDDRTYSEAEGDSVEVTVDGESVDPQSYVLEGVGPVDNAAAGAGDNVEIVAESGN